MIFYFLLQVWSDWKTKTKKKVFIKTQDMCGTGGGTSKGKPLRQLEERVLRVIGLTSTTRNQAIQEAGLEVSNPFKNIWFFLKTRYRPPTYL